MESFILIWHTSGMKAFGVVISLMFLSLNAAAEVNICLADLDTTVLPKLSPQIDTALQKFEAGLRQLPVSGGESLASRLATWYKLKPFRGGVAALLKVFVPMAARASVCERFVNLAVQYNAPNNRPQTIAQMVENLCPGDKRAAILQITGAQMEIPVAQQDPRWIRGLIRNSSLSMSDWRDLLAANPRARLETLSAVVGPDWSKIGFYPDDQEQMARLALSQQFSVYSLKRLFRLQDGQLASLSSSMDPLQWLELMQRSGYPVVDINKDLKSRIAKFKRAGEMTDRQGQGVARNLFLDESLDEDTFAAVYATLQKNWRKIYGPNAKFELPALDRTKLSARQLGRLRALAAPALDPYKKVRAAARKSMKPVVVFLSTMEFKTMADFRQAFDLSRRYVTTANTSRDPEERERAQTIAKIYSKVLAQRLDDFQALNPKAADIRWFSEASMGLPMRVRRALR